MQLERRAEAVFHAPAADVAYGHGAARHLGITRPKLYRLLRVRGLEPASFRPS